MGDDLETLLRNLRERLDDSVADYVLVDVRADELSELLNAFALLQMRVEGRNAIVEAITKAAQVDVNRRLCDIMVDRKVGPPFRLVEAIPWRPAVKSHPGVATPNDRVAFNRALDKELSNNDERLRERMECLVVELAACIETHDIHASVGIKEDGSSDCFHDTRCGCPQAVVLRDAKSIAEVLNARANGGAQ